MIKDKLGCQAKKATKVNEVSQDHMARLEERAIKEMKAIPERLVFLDNQVVLDYLGYLAESAIRVIKETRVVLA